MKIFNDSQILRSLVDGSFYLIGQFSASVVDFLCYVSLCFLSQNNSSDAVKHPLTTGGAGFVSWMEHTQFQAFLRILLQISKLVQTNLKHKSHTHFTLHAR